MQVQSLPLISSSYALFDWNTPCGNATTEQLRSAYTALTSNGLTSDFSRYVWNDLVNRLSGAISSAGLSWDGTYGTASATKIAEQYGSLTAERFNAMLYNLELLINTNWPWSYDRTVAGYLGRSLVCGVSNYGSNADIVYGSYIIELARVVNLFISILKNEADFAEFAHYKIFNSLKDSTFKALPSAPLLVEFISNATSYSSLVKVPTIHINVNHRTTAFSNAQSVALPSIRVTSQSHASSFQDGIIILKPPIPLTYSGETTAWDKSTAEKAPSKPMAHRSTTYSYANTEMLKEFVAKPTKKLASITTTTLNLSAITDIVLALPAYAKEMSKISMNADVVYFPPMQIEANVESGISDNAGISINEALPISVAEVSNTTSESELVHANYVDVYATIISKSNVSANLMFSDIRHDPIQTGNSLYITSVHPQWQEGNVVHLDSGGVFYDAEQTEGSIYIRSVDSMKGEWQNG